MIGPGHSLAEHEHALALFGECPSCVVAAARPSSPVEKPEQARLPRPTPDPDGRTFRPALDRDRLGAQAQRVWNEMMDGEWHTLAGLAAATGDPEASVSARLRDFRKDGWGGHVVVAEREPTLLGDGTWRYRLVPRGDPRPATGEGRAD